MDMIDQKSLWHVILKKDFGIVPRIGWKIDPLGHLIVQTYLLIIDVGFDELFFKMDIVIQSREDCIMEMGLHSSSSFGTIAEVFIGILANIYTPPDDFNFGIVTT